MAKGASIHFLYILWKVLFKHQYSFLSLRLEGEETLKYRCICRSRAEKFNIVSNDHGHPHKFDISVSDRKYHFWAHLGQKIKIISLSWNLVPRLIQISRIQRRYSLVFCFRLEFPFLGKFGPKKRNCQFKLKFVI